MSLEITVNARPPDAVVTIAGPLDVSSAFGLRDELAARIEGGCSRLLVDLAEVTFLDAAGIGTLVEGHRLAARSGGSLRIARASNRTSRLLEALDLGSLLGSGADAPQVLNEVMAT